MTMMSASSPTMYIPLLVLVSCSYLECIMDFNGLYKNMPIPWDLVPDTETVFEFKDNLMASMNWIPRGKQLTSFSLSINLLTEVPDLTNLSSTLIDIILMSNQIKRVGPEAKLTKMTVLRKLLLKDNPLVSIPDPAHCGPWLSNMGLILCPMTSFPNMCQLDTSQRIDNVLRLFFQYGEGFGPGHFICRQNMIWGKLAYDFGIMASEAEDPECAEPAGVLFKDLTVEGMLARDEAKKSGFIESLFEILPDPERFYCYPNIEEIIPGLSVMQCANECLLKPSCVLFTSDENKCVLTSYGTIHGTYEQFHKYDRWFVLRPEIKI